mgnify:FL=1
MGTINDKIEYLAETKNLIKQAIIAKGQAIEDTDTFRSYASKIQNISTGIDTSDANATMKDILTGKTAYVNGEKITGTIANNGDLVVTPSTDEQDNSAGYYTSIQVRPVTSAIDTNIKTENIKSNVSILGVTGSVIELNGHEVQVTPSTKQKIITPEENYNALTKVTVDAVTNTIDSNIQAGNIKKDVNILGVIGTYEGLNTNDANATAADLLPNKTAYVKGELITGSMNKQSTATCTQEVNAELLSETSEVKVEGKWDGSETTYIDNTCILGAKISYASLANIIGLTANKIKSGETILGIEGTYTGETV